LLNIESSRPYRRLMLRQTGQARDTSGECVVASLALIRRRVLHVKALGLPKRSRPAFMASRAFMLVCARTAGLQRVEKAPHDLPTARRAEDFVAPVKPPTGSALPFLVGGPIRAGAAG